MARGPVPDESGRHGQIYGAVRFNAIGDLQQVHDLSDIVADQQDAVGLLDGDAACVYMQNGTQAEVPEDGHVQGFMGVRNFLSPAARMSIMVVSWFDLLMTNNTIVDTEGFATLNNRR